MSSFLPTIVNVLTVICGSLAGVLFHRILQERFRELIFQSLGLVTILIGLRDAMESQHIPFVALSLIIGAVLGEALNFETHLNNTGIWLHRVIQHKDERFVDGFVNASLLFCVGGMTIVGSLQAGVSNNGDILYTKATMDGLAAVFLAGAMGVGVLFSSLTILLVQGLLTAVFFVMGKYIPPTTVTELSAIGGLMIVAIGLNLLGMVKIRVGNLLPGLVVIYIIMTFMS